MKKTFRQILAVILTLVMVLGIAPFGALSTAAAVAPAAGKSRVKSIAELEGAKGIGANGANYAYIATDIMEHDEVTGVWYCTDGYVQPGQHLRMDISFKTNLYSAPPAPSFVYDWDFFDIYAPYADINNNMVKGADSAHTISVSVKQKDENPSSKFFGRFDKLYLQSGFCGNSVNSFFGKTLKNPGFLTDDWINSHGFISYSVTAKKDGVQCSYDPSLDGFAAEKWNEDTYFLSLYIDVDPDAQEGSKGVIESPNWLWKACKMIQSPASLKLTPVRGKSISGLYELDRCSDIANNYTYGTTYRYDSNGITATDNTDGIFHTEDCRHELIIGEPAYKTGDEITFGSYPQSKVTDSATLSALNAMSKDWISYGYYTGTHYYDNSVAYHVGSESDGNMKPSDYMNYCDLSYNGEKYRAVTFSSYRPYNTGDVSLKTNSCQFYNGYEEGNTYYFKYEPLTWRVLDPSDGYVLCENAIDSQAYNNYLICGKGSLSPDNEYYGNPEMTYYASDWANCSLRDWLNNDFYNTAFKAEEKSQIGTAYNENKSTYSAAYDSVNTSDKIFLLSYDDMLNTSYGFSFSSSRWLKATDYAKCQGCDAETSTGYEGNSFWLLRSHSDSGHAALVNPDGDVSPNCIVNNTSSGIVPAMKVKLTAGITLDANNGTDAAETKTAANFRPFSPECTFTNVGLNFCGWYKDADCTEPWTSADTVTGSMTLYAGWTEYKTGDTVMFGSYPQTLVEDEQLIEELNAAAPADNKTWKSFGFYTGSASSGTVFDATYTEDDFFRYWDVQYGTETYRAVVFDAYRPFFTCDKPGSSSEQKNYGLTVGEVYWFRWDPVEWTVLDVNEMLIYSSKILAVEPFTNTIYDNPEKRLCFTDSTFTRLATDYSVSHMRDWLNNDFYNAAFSTEEKAVVYGTVIENGSLFADYPDETVRDNVFILSLEEASDETYGLTDEDRAKTGTDYARYQGLYKDSESDTSWWWLRTPYGTSSRLLSSIYVNGKTGDRTNAFSCRVGVVPAMRVNLKSGPVKKPLTENMVQPIPSQDYTGSETVPAVTVKNGNNLLVKDSDYTVSCKNNVSAGMATLTVKGKGDYLGEVSVPFTINPRTVDISWSDEPLVYNGSAQCPAATITNKAGNDEVFPAVEGEQTDAGKNYTATVTGLTGKNAENYAMPEDAPSYSFSILQASVENGTAAAVPAQDYTGEAVTPKPGLTVGGKLLTEGTDYDYTYESNLGAGPATVTFNGKGNYTGTLSQPFEIRKVGQSAPAGLVKTDETKCSASDGKISGVSTEMEYAFERGAYKACNGTEITGLAPGTYHVRYAADDNHYASDAVQLVIGKGACWGGEATCTAKGKCRGCGTEYIETDPANHVNTKNVPAQPAACTAVGYTAGVYCNDCGKWISGHEEIPAGHRFSALVPAQDSTCTAEGHDAYYVCDGCGKYFDENKTEISGIPYRELAPHADNDGDGRCDGCGEQLKSECMLLTLLKGFIKAVIASVKAFLIQL